MWLPLSNINSFGKNIQGVHRFIVENGSKSGSLLKHSAYNTPKITFWILFDIKIGSKDYSSKCRFRSQIGNIGVIPLYQGSNNIPILLPRGAKIPNIAIFKDNPITSEIIQSTNRHKKDNQGINYHFGKAIQTEINANLYPKLGRLETGALDINGNYIGYNENPPEMSGEMIYAKKSNYQRFNANNPNDSFRKSIGEYRYYGVKTLVPIYSVDKTKLNTFVKNKLKFKEDINVIDYTENTITLEDETYWIKFLNTIFPNRKEKDLTFTIENKQYKLDYKNKTFIDIETLETLIGIQTSKGIFTLDRNKYIQTEITKKYSEYINLFISKVKSKEFKKQNKSEVRLPNTNEILNLNPFLLDCSNYFILKSKGNITKEEKALEILGTNQYKLQNINQIPQYYLHQKDLINNSPKDDAFTRDGQSVFWNTKENTSIEIPYWSRAILKNIPEYEEDKPEIEEEIKEKTNNSPNLNSELLFNYTEYPMFKDFDELTFEGINETIVFNMNIQESEQINEFYNIKCKPMFKVKEITCEAEIQIGTKTIIDSNDYNNFEDLNEENITEDFTQNIENNIQETKELDSKLTKIKFSPFLYIYPNLVKSPLKWTEEIKKLSPLSTPNNPIYITEKKSFESNLGYYEQPDTIDFNFWYAPQHFLNKYNEGIKGIEVKYELNNQNYTELIENLDIVEFKEQTHSKKLQVLKHLPTLPFYFKDFHLCENTDKVSEIWVIPIPIPGGIIPIPFFYKRKVFQIRHSPLQLGDWFYHTSDKYTNLFFKTNSIRTDLYDRFENPNYKQDRGNDRLLAKIDNTKRLPGIYRKRQLGAELESHQQSLRYLERPIINNAPNGTKNVSPSDERLNTSFTSLELENSNLAKKRFSNYIEYFSSSNPQYLTKYWYKQNFSLIFMLNADLRKVKHLCKMTWQYLNFIADLNLIPNNSWTNITLLIPHRLPSPIMRKTIKIRRYKMTEEEINNETQLYRCILKNDILTCYSKINGYICELDMESYIPNYKNELGLNKDANQIRKELIQMKLEQIWKFSKVKNIIDSNGKTAREQVGILDNRESWIYFFDDIDIYPNELGGFNGRTKPIKDFYTKYKEYLEEQSQENLLNLYNEIKQSNNKLSERTSFFQITNEYSNYDGNNPIINNNKSIYKSPFIPKYKTLEGTNFEIDNLNPKTLIATQKDIVYAYNSKTILYMYDKALYHQEQNNILDFKQFWYADNEIDILIISKKDIIEFLILEAQKVLNESTPYITIAKKYSSMYSKKDSLCFKLLPSNGEYSLKQLIYDTYIVVPEEVLLTFNSSQIEMNVVRGFKELYQKSLIITNLNRKTKGSIYYYHYLPLYADFWKKLSYPNKHFIKKLFCNLETWSINIIEEETNSGGLIDTLKAIISSLLMLHTAILATISGQLVMWQIVLLWLSTTFGVLTTILQALAGLCVNGAMKNKLLKIAKGFALATQVVGVVNIVINIGSTLTSESSNSMSLMDKTKDYFNNITTQQALSVLNFGLGAVQKLVDVYTKNELEKDTKKLEQEQFTYEALSKEYNILEEDIVSIGALAKYPMDLNKFTHIDRHLDKANLDMITYEGIEQTFDIFTQDELIFD